MRVNAPILAKSTNREIDYDVMNDIVPIVIWHYCRNAVGRGITIGF
jgi:hypothetical protein